MTTKASEEDYIKYRLEKAWKTFEDAKSLAKINDPQIGRWNQLFNTVVLFFIITDLQF